MLQRPPDARGLGTGSCCVELTPFRKASYFLIDSRTLKSCGVGRESSVVPRRQAKVLAQPCSLSLFGGCRRAGELCWGGDCACGSPRAGVTWHPRWGRCRWAQPWAPAVLTLTFLCVSHPGMDGNASAGGTEGQHRSPHRKAVSLLGAAGHLPKGEAGAAAKDLLCG